MGQYYRVITEDSVINNHKRTVYNRDVDGEYTMAKLMEHSWWENPFVNTICTEIYQSPKKVAWVGDYANEFELFDEVWDSEGVGVKENQTKLNGKYLCNHTLGEYVDCNDYYAHALRDGWCVHPLPILTCIGNGGGGGDYYSKADRDLVGRWNWHIVSVENSAPDGYEKLECCFVE